MEFKRTQIIFPIVDFLTFVLDFRLRTTVYVPITVSIFTSTSPTKVEGRKRGHDKMADVDVDTKQRMVVEFLTAEKVSPEEIHARLKLVYEEEAVDLACVRNWAHRPGESDMSFRGRLVQRAIIQFLTAEGEKPLEISQRLAIVYNTVPYSRCTVWRWAKRYSSGNPAIGDKIRLGRLPLNSTLVDISVTSSSEYS